eukprot:Plantae.Rhodophyta-Hildenbrandia_rubra.ctg15255.p1 GENE.Plantae.Rhodophyta-Hildenbrandia_rubra.ctg15255~~Plantae.Rhodophyta-Hildenbrandia_rubra.ctg15255.p1  ORF type:complete len:255 (-),score=35.31 Plantae.Rhodophyta-Hildenbrandia_rubra.ctg15255:739-1503(-)
MRITRTKSTRKALTFYRINYDVHPPYRLLIDGPMLSYCVTSNLHIRTTFSNLLQAPTHPLTTICIQRELRKLGAPFKGATLLSKKLRVVECGHEGDPQSAAECIVETAKKENAGVATRDVELEKVLKSVEGVFVVGCVGGSRIVVHSPGWASMKNARRKQKEREAVKDDERDLARRIRKERKAESIGVDPKNVRPARPVIGKRKRAKEPNPLSVKKKKVNKSDCKDLQKVTIRDSQGARKRRRRRRKSKEPVAE